MIIRIFFIINSNLVKYFAIKKAPQLKRIPNKSIDTIEGYLDMNFDYDRHKKIVFFFII